MLSHLEFLEKWEHYTENIQGSYDSIIEAQDKIQYFINTMHPEVRDQLESLLKISYEVVSEQYKISLLSPDYELMDNLKSINRFINIIRSGNSLYKDILYDIIKGSSFQMLPIRTQLTIHCSQQLVSNFNDKLRLDTNDKKSFLKKIVNPYRQNNSIVVHSKYVSSVMYGKGKVCPECNVQFVVNIEDILWTNLDEFIFLGSHTSKIHAPYEMISSDSRITEIIHCNWDDFIVDDLTNNDIDNISQYINLYTKIKNSQLNSSSILKLSILFNDDKILKIGGVV